MEILKVFPSLLLDALSKVLPGSLFILMFRDRYSSISKIGLDLVGPPPLAVEWKYWHSIFIFTVSAYAIGIFIAIVANKVDAVLIQRRWFPILSRSPNKFIYQKAQTEDFSQSLNSSRSFLLYIEYYRGFVAITNVAAAFNIEKHRTVFRLFLGVCILFLALALDGEIRDVPKYIGFSILFGSLAYKLHRNYLMESIQSISAADAAAAMSSKVKNSIADP